MWTPNPEWRCACPRVVLLCRNPHLHARPPRSKTPKIIEDIFQSLLLQLGWRLADATARRITTNQLFVDGLKRVLGWSNLQWDPVPSDLHPSLGNHDHTALLINKIREPLYPDGTDFEGECLLNS
jgi:hypothetical protein